MSNGSERRHPTSGRLRSTGGRKRLNGALAGVCLATALLALVIVAVLLTVLMIQGRHYLSFDFLRRSANPDPNQAGIAPALWGTIWVCGGCTVLALPLGIATAILLEEFKPRQWAMRGIHGFVQLNITNLAGVPSVVYGIIGLTAFANMFGLFGGSHASSFELGATYYDQYITEGSEIVRVVAESSQAEPTPLRPGISALTTAGKRVHLSIVQPGEALPIDQRLLERTLRSDADGSRIDRKRWYFISLPLGRGVLTGSLTLMLVVLPIVIIASQESLRGVPDSLREAALGMGTTRWQMVRQVTLPAAIPGIMTGAILAMSRAIGEAAPLLMISGIVYIAQTPEHLMDDFSVLPLQIYNWAGRPQSEFHQLAASGILVLLAVLLVFNTVAVFIRQRFQRPQT